MRKVVLHMQVTLDGFVGARDGEVAWAFPGFDEEFTALTLETLWQAGVHVMGAETGKGLGAYWPAPSEERDIPFAAPMNEIPKVVFSRTIDRLDWQSTRIELGDVAEELERLKGDVDGDPEKTILVHGGVRFVHSLVRAGLIDEYRLMVHPVVLGAGLSLFPELPGPLRMDVIETRPLQSGVTYQVLRPRTNEA